MITYKPRWNREAEGRDQTAAEDPVQKSTIGVNKVESGGWDMIDSTYALRREKMMTLLALQKNT